MEDSWVDLFSNWEMGVDDFFNIQSHMSLFKEGEYSPGERDVQQPVFSPNLSSSSLQSNLELPYSSSTTGEILSFDNPLVAPLHPQNDYAKSMEQSHCVKPKAHPRTNAQDHIVAERKRREELTRCIIALSATIPGLNKTDKVSVLREAVNYMKQLQERVKELENQMRKECVNSIILSKKTLLCINDRVEELPEVKVTMLDKEVLIGVHCEKQRKVLHKILSLLNNLHLSITSTSVLPFGSSTLKITIISQMDDEYNMTVDDLAKTLSQRILSLKSHDM